MLHLQYFFSSNREIYLLFIYWWNRFHIRGGVPFVMGMKRRLFPSVLLIQTNGDFFSIVCFIEPSCRKKSAHVYTTGTITNFVFDGRINAHSSSPALFLHHCFFMNSTVHGIVYTIHFWICRIRWLLF